MTISKQLMGGAKFATLLAMSWAVGVAIESRLESVPASASGTIAQVSATAPAPATQETSWWKPAADALR
jgi:hypothetical protein